jgi:hypothetical protein
MKKCKNLSQAKFKEGDLVVDLGGMLCRIIYYNDVCDEYAIRFNPDYDGVWVPAYDIKRKANAKERQAYLAELV